MSISPELLESAEVWKRALTGEEVEALDRLATTYRRVSVADLSALHVALVERFILITDDGPLREAARQEGVICHGTLWILDELVQGGWMDCERACMALHEMLNAGARFPRTAVLSLRKRWSCP